MISVYPKLFAIIKARKKIITGTKIAKIIFCFLFILNTLFIMINLFRVLKGVSIQEVLLLQLL